MRTWVGAVLLLGLVALSWRPPGACAQMPPWRIGTCPPEVDEKCDLVTATKPCRTDKDCPFPLKCCGSCVKTCVHPIHTNHIPRGRRPDTRRAEERPGVKQKNRI
ncbi:hypothetical protein NDU88_011686 [Pleurodeles waltl]|uniref:WAP domain-containing protein n=1 Tax=Pleurodeles waltl TaxID=8319 RepID=A0AAV7S2J2_PLEWA|nr:hypothetical protein NDU88_011686 [Pleurodeles waltl]